MQVKWLYSRAKGYYPAAFSRACRSGHLEIARWLHDSCPACQAWSKKYKGQTPWSPNFEFFLGNRKLTHAPPVPILPISLEMLKWLLEKYEIEDTLYLLMANAVIAGDQACLQFLMEQPEEYHQAARQSENHMHRPPLMELAARHGRVDMLPVVSKLSGPDANLPCIELFW